VCDKKYCRKRYILGSQKLLDEHILLEHTEFVSRDIDQGKKRPKKYSKRGYERMGSGESLKYVLYILILRFLLKIELYIDFNLFSDRIPRRDFFKVVREMEESMKKKKKKRTKK